ncbi:hypothetical protein SODALDRAFT_333083 [Sodiomyces alkalinus F11]|uniref:Protein kinase domain-containing protein n=1 Tax=Sodiomyces alkalinus (strain CBS 110278 / VKM F-3762 / F11) TaxID=1314773 RepID=A0A3N2PVG5_SODAK|nr:hypothetical protein SODALDRAFT_333083 [Sodiomyces alkalinus F11]ROT38489.1 hypothetical protein SODALDRAFT_333083 [Sodiomyces alkalinus F11]
MSDVHSVEELRKLLLQAQLRAEKAERERQQERDRAEREQQRAEEAERERQQEQDRAEREQQRAEEAERERQQEQDRAEREQQRAETAERERQQEQDRAEREQQRAEEAENQTQPTTLDEYIAACHSLVFSQLRVERDRRLTSRGSITNPRNKLCPSRLEPWPQFLDQQRSVFDTIYECFPTEARVFESRSFLTGLGKRVSQRSIADEKSLEYFMHNSVEDPVRVIVEQLKQVEDARIAFDIGSGIVFENHPHVISDVAEEVVAARENASTPPQTPLQTSLPTPNHKQGVVNQLRPDQICVYRSDDDDTALEKRIMIYVSEYKAPHKLTAPHLRAGLRQMDIYKEVVNRKTIPTSVDPEGRFQYHAERLTASALAQTYHYMIEGGLEYGLMTTGEATVFLKIDWDTPETLYYHLAEPGPEVTAHVEYMQSSSAVGQYLAFTLMALVNRGERGAPGQDIRDRAMVDLKRWTEDFETTLRSIPDGERQAPESSSSWAPTTYGDVDRSPSVPRGGGGRRPPRRQPRRWRGEGDEHEKYAIRRDQPDSSSDESGMRPPDTPSPAERRRRREQQGQGSETEPRRKGAARDRQYCTQACLLGLVGGSPLDPRCPNIESHRYPDSARHAHTRHPLRQSLDAGITKLGRHGARGVLFKVTLLAYGYTFICKGTVQAFIRDLEHEAAVYKRLKPVQGIHVPVFLGAVDLRPLKRVYYYDHRVYIVHMTFLSWGGDDVDKIERKLLESLRAIHEEGVVHRDTDTVMLVDFEPQMVPNKQVAGGEKSGYPSNRVWFAEDDLMASFAYRRNRTMVEGR